MAAVPPILQGLAGKPVNVETLGGYLQYKYGTFFPLVVSLWSILALSGTLAAEARRGSLEFVAADPMTRRRIALEKLFGHVTSIVIAMRRDLRLDRDRRRRLREPAGRRVRRRTAAAGYAIWLGLLALAAGSVAFALAPVLGRGAAAGIAGAITFGGFLLNGYQAAIPALAPFANLTWFGWTSDHLPLAGQFDWAPLVLVAVVVIVLCAVGIEAFVRRDLGATSAIPWPGLPRALAGHPRADRTDGQREPADGAGVGHRARPVRPLDRGFRTVVRRAARIGAGLPEAPRQHLPGHRHRHRRRLPAAPVRRVRAGAGRACRGHARRGMGVR